MLADSAMKQEHPNPKLAKREEPELNFFESGTIDRLAQMMLAMASELHVLRDRVRCLEFLLERRGDLDPAELEHFVPDSREAEILRSEREAFVGHLYEVIDGRAKSTSGRFGPSMDRGGSGS
jgi:hypothetical protein